MSESTGKDLSTVETRGSARRKGPPATAPYSKSSDISKSTPVSTTEGKPVPAARLLQSINRLSTISQATNVASAPLSSAAQTQYDVIKAALDALPATTTRHRLIPPLPLSPLPPETDKLLDTGYFDNLILQGLPVFTSVPDPSVYEPVVQHISPVERPVKDITTPPPPCKKRASSTVTSAYKDPVSTPIQTVTTQKSPATPKKKGCVKKCCSPQNNGVKFQPLDPLTLPGSTLCMEHLTGTCQIVHSLYPSENTKSDYKILNTNGYVNFYVRCVGPLSSLRVTLRDGHSHFLLTPPDVCNIPSYCPTCNQVIHLNSPTNW